jgi:4,5-dihydroxyphthalate decarboxylase
MTDTELTAVTRTQGCTQALKDGTVTPPGFRLRFEEVPVLVRGFRRMVRGLEFGVSEMAFTTYLCARAAGVAFTAIPVFPVRAFHHSAVRHDPAASGLRGPRDLEGRKAGVNRGFTVTTGVWARGILADEYGVDLDRVTWMPSGDEHVEPFRLPPNVVRLPPGADLAGLTAAGELAACVGAVDDSRLVPLIPDAAEAGFAALASRGCYPINHLVVVRDDLLAAHPGLAAALFTAYAEAKNRYVGRLRDGRGELAAPEDRRYRRVMEITGGDPLPYGIGPNRAMISELIRHAVSQQIIDRPVAPEALFAAGTHGLAA